MANNQNVNKVVYAGNTLIDLTGDDVTAGDVLSGKKFHLPSGAQAIGTMSGGEVYAAISVTYPAGSVCTATNGTITLTADDTSGQVVFGIPEPSSTPETWTVSSTDGIDTDVSYVDIIEYGSIEFVELMYFPLEPFSTATDEQFTQMIQAAHAGKMDLHIDANWNIGDTRTIYINSFRYNNGSSQSSAQYVDIVIGSFSDYENCGCVLQFDFKDGLSNTFRMNSSNTNAGGYNNTEMFNTTIPGMVNALPNYLKNLLIEFSCKASAGSQSSTINTISGNKLALRSEIEIFGTTTYSKDGEGLQIPYYEIASNRQKKKGHAGTYDIWWTRSPRKDSNGAFCAVTSDGDTNPYPSSYSEILAPFGCI